MAAQSAATDQIARIISQAQADAQSNDVLIYPAYPDGHDAGNYTLATLGAKVKTFTGNVYQDPGFADVSTSYTTTPTAFDFTRS